MRLNSKSWAIALLSTAAVLATDLSPALHLGGAPAMARPGGGGGDQGSAHGSGSGFGGARSNGAVDDRIGSAGSPNQAAANVSAVTGQEEPGRFESASGKAVGGCCGIMSLHQPFTPNPTTLRGNTVDSESRSAHQR